MPRATISELILACEEGDLRLIAQLLRRGGPGLVNHLYDNWTPLITAALHGNEAAVKLLLGKGAKLNLADNEGFTAVSGACGAGHKATVLLLLDNGASINLASKGGATPLSLATQNRHTTVVEQLLDRGAEIDHANNKGATALIIATFKGHTAEVELLLDRGAEIDHATNEGCTALIIASFNGRTAEVELLLDRGAEINHATNEGFTSLYLACKNKHDAIARLLARRGASIDQDDIDIAKDKGQRKLAKWLNRVRGHTSIHWACEDRDREGLLRVLRSDEFERALPPLAELEKIARRGKTPTCERSVRLLRLAAQPWDVLRRHVWPRSFRDRIVAVMDVTRNRGDEAICFAILSFCGRDWWAGHGPVLGDARVPPPMRVAELLRWRVCDECQECPMRRPRRCTGCRAVSYCGRQDESGGSACQHAAWGGHKQACKEAKAENKRLKQAKRDARAKEKRRVKVEEEEAVVAAVAAAAATAKLAKAKKEAARKKEQKKRAKKRKAEAAANPACGDCLD